MEQKRAHGEIETENKQAAHRVLLRYLEGAGPYKGKPPKNSNSGLLSRPYSLRKWKLSLGTDKEH